MTRLRLRRIFWRGAAAILVAAALIAVGSVLKGSFSSTDGRILGSLALFLYTGGALFSGLALVERGRSRVLGWAVIAASPMALTLMLLWVWTWVDESGDEHHWRAAWSGMLVLLSGLLAATAVLLARGRALERLAYMAGVLASVAGLLSVVAIWVDRPGTGLAKAIGAAWILAVLAWALVPVLRRWASPESENRERVLGMLGDVELVVTTSTAGSIALDVPRLGPGERLVLRRRPG